MQNLLTAGWKFPADVQGWLTEDEGKILARFATGQKVLEIGSFQGRSTICMAQTASEVHSVDHHSGDINSGAGGTLESLKENLERYGLGWKVNLNVEPFAEYAPKQLPGSFDFVFVDAAHDEINVAHDATQALRLVKPNGLIAFHDWNWQSVRVGAARANRIFAEKPLGRVDNIAWFSAEKTKTEPVKNVSIEVCIPSRDGRIDDDVLMRAYTACEYAARRGVPCELARVKDAYTVATCRNRGVAGFLSREHRTHLLFLDDDVLLPAHGIEALARAAERIEGVICGCVPSVRIDSQGNVAGYVQVKPFAADWLTEWPTEEIQAEGCGGGCMLIPRKIIELIEFPWFRWPESYKPGFGVRAITDDTDFCNRVIALGHAVTAIPVRCGHKKTIDVSILIPE